MNINDNKSNEEALLLIGNIIGLVKTLQETANEMENDEYEELMKTLAVCSDTNDTAVVATKEDDPPAMTQEELFKQLSHPTKQKDPKNEL